MAIRGHGEEKRVGSAVIRMTGRKIVLIYSLDPQEAYQVWDIQFV